MACNASAAGRADREQLGHKSSCFFFFVFFFCHFIARILLIKNRLKQSDVKWLPHTNKLAQTVAGTLSLKMKCNHCLFCSVAETEHSY